MLLTLTPRQTQASSICPACSIFSLLLFSFTCLNVPLATSSDKPRNFLYREIDICPPCYYHMHPKVASDMGEHHGFSFAQGSSVTTFAVSKRSYLSTRPNVSFRYIATSTLVLDTSSGLGGGGFKVNLALLHNGITIWAALTHHTVCSLYNYEITLYSLYLVCLSP